MGRRTPTGRVRYHFMKVVTAIEGKAQPVKQFGGAGTRSVVLDTRTRISSWRSSMAGYTMLARNRQPRHPRHFRIPLQPMKDSQPISIQPTACSKPRKRHTDCGTMDLQSATFGGRGTPSGVRPAASRPPVITQPHRTRGCAAAAGHRHPSGRASAHVAPTRSAGTTPTRSGSAPRPTRSQVSGA